jgi:hypothetical protein
LDFRLDVLPSEDVCGFGNITLDGQLLPQSLDGEVLAGKGSIATDRESIVAASWSFHCVKANGQSDAQLLKFIVDSVDGKAMDDVGFAVLFRQTDTTEILHIEKDLSIPDYVVANPDPEGLLPIDEHINFPQYSIEDDIAELDFMWAQLRELQYLIAEKEREIAEQYSQNFDEDIKDCDILKCVVSTVANKARNVAHALYEKIHGHHEEHDEEVDGFPKNSFKHRPGKGKHGKPGNHTCGPPKHGKGNHTHPPHWRKPHWRIPHWRKPHFPHRPLPICRYPPPHHGPPHHGPPHRGPPHGPPHGPPPHGKPPGSSHGPPGRDGFPLAPPHDDDHPEFPPPLPPHHGEGFPDHPHPLFEDNQGPPGPPHGKGHHGPHSNGFDGPRHNRVSKSFHITKFAVIGFFFAFLIIALHRRTCNQKSRASRQARREERHRRRAYRRAAHKHRISRFFARFSNDGSNDSADYEEKRERLLADAENGICTTMTEEIVQLRNAVGVIGDLVAAEEGRTQGSTQASTQTRPIPIAKSEERPLIQDFETGSQVEDGEELPAYEDNDGSEDSSVVADGFRYTPGSTEYSPSHSASGSMSDTLGPDTKQ